MAEATRCPRCGNVLSGDLGGRCPECLLQAGMMASSEGPSGPATVDYPREGKNESRPTPPTPGHDFGRYHLVRGLGQGGMGTVFEAEEKGTGRRLALKVLSHSLDSPTARQRFIREGRLMASMNHPHSVYVFGAEEIDGAPVITMELVQGGTLQDRVRRQGPLPVAEAVDATLQIIDGLEAAHAVGVLHRDVKPSNCFVDADGQVKIGDFGLSISKAARGDLNLTSSGVFLGTPTFASPEQLRGDELDQRSDLYAVGVTLYYLLTGKVPFEADQMVKLVAMVLENPTPNVRTLRPETPRELARVLQGCLEKDPARRYRRYAELRTALLPFSTMVPSPATPALRFTAGLIDSLILLGMYKAAWSLLLYLNVPAMLGLYWYSIWLDVVLGLSLWSLYYAVPEGLLGFSLGKRLLGLRVVRRGTMNPPGLVRSAIRTLIYEGLTVAPVWLFVSLVQQSALAMRIFDAQGTLVWFLMAGATASASYVLSYVAWALLFVTIRPGNGYAAVHDRLSGTRVIFRPSAITRPIPTLSPLANDAVQPGLASVGFYHLLSPLGCNEAGEWHLGYDARLLRKVWIRIVPMETPAVETAMRNQSRSGRLRWLTGRRGSEENWDVFEAPSGQALWTLLKKPHEWDEVRYWLLDLSKELAAALTDGTLPPALGLDRVWITAEGRAKLFDFPVPGLSTAVSASQLRQSGEVGPVREFLHQVAAAGLRGQRLDCEQARQESFALPLPLHARPIVDGLSKVQRPEVIAAEIQQQLDKPTRVTRARRLSLLAVCLVIPMLAAGLGAASMPSTLWEMFERPEILFLLDALTRYTDGHDGNGPTAEEKAALEIYITGHYRERIKDPTFWEHKYAYVMTPQRKLAEEIVARTPVPSPEDLKKAAKIAYADEDPLDGDDAEIARMLAGESDLYGGIPFWLVVFLAFALGFGIVLVLLLACLSIVCALIFRGGFLWRVFSIAAVTRDGRLAGRWRLTWRQLIAWSPVLGIAAFATIPIDPIPGYDQFSWALDAIALGLIVTSVCFLKRSLPDRLAGTWLVIR